MEIEKSVNAQKAYFATCATLPISYRLEMLKSLKTAIKKLILKLLSILQPILNPIFVN